jgi:hypothetical protein
MDDRYKIGKPPIKNNTNTSSKTLLVKNIPANNTKQIPIYTKSINPNTSLGSNKSNSYTTTDKNVSQPSPPNTSTSAITNALQITTAANHRDNTSAFDNPNVIVLTDHNTQSHSVSSIKPPSSFATITANEKTPSREQAIVFNSIEGVRQLEYILAIGKLVSPREIIFTSRISNNRFCIFLSSKEALETLLKNRK